MPCILALLALVFPRIVLAVLFFFTNYLDRAIPSMLVLLLGFLILPLTTLVYAWTMNVHGAVEGIYLVAIIIAVMFDVGSLGGGEVSRRRRA
jgi:hypothetical protein